MKTPILDEKIVLLEWAESLGILTESGKEILDEFKMIREELKKLDGHSNKKYDLVMEMLNSIFFGGERVR